MTLSIALHKLPCNAIINNSSSRLGRRQITANLGTPQRRFGCLTGVWKCPDLPIFVASPFYYLIRSLASRVFVFEQTRTIGIRDTIMYVARHKEKFLKTGRRRRQPPLIRTRSLKWALLTKALKEGVERRRGRRYIRWTFDRRL